MARKSRKPILIEQAPPAARETGYQTAIYARLSIEDNGVSGDSMEHQIEIVRSYLAKHSDLHLVHTWTDNGRTGTDFERPGFHGLMEAVRKGEINCIAVKDLSRFGRNYLETGDYLEKVFPYFGVRFISVNDQFDSLHRSEESGLIVPLKAILHDHYAKDISKKICTSLDIRKKSGKFMGKIPPYGYVRDPQNRHRLVVHQERADVVRQVFRWRLEGKGAVAIARRLNEQEVPTQLQIRFREGYADGKEDALWHGFAVAAMLKNPCYLGCIVERKGSNAFYQGRQEIAIPKEQWNLIRGTHEAIIEEDVFCKVQAFMEMEKQKRQKQIEGNSDKERTKNLLAGVVKCGVCGASVQRGSGSFHRDGTRKHYSFYCSKKYLKTGCCPSKAVDERALLNAVYQICKKQLELLTDLEVLLAEAENNARAGSCLSVGQTEWNGTEGSHLYDVELGEGRRARARRQRDARFEKLPGDEEGMEKLLEWKHASGLFGPMCEVMIRQLILSGDRVQVLFSFADEWGPIINRLAQRVRACGAVARNAYRAESGK